MAKVLVLDPQNPRESAIAFVKSHMTDSSGLRSLHRYRDHFYHFVNPHYRALADGEVRKAVWDFLASSCRISESPDTKEKTKAPFKPNTSLVNNVIDALGAICSVDNDPELPIWLPSSGSAICHPSEILAVSNGLLHLPTGRLYPSTPAFFSLSASDVKFDPAAEKPYQWHRFLDDLFDNDEEARHTLQEWFGYLLTPDTSLQKILLIVGPRRGGKGTIGRIKKALLGSSSVASMTLANLSQQFGLQHLIGKIACVIPDARFSARADPAVVAERLLSISGEDALPIDRKFKGAWEGPLKVRFTIMTNELPNLMDSSGALVERFVVIQLRRSFAGREDPTLYNRLRAELPGILNWAIEGYCRLKKHGRFEMPTSSADTIRAMKDIESPVSSFVAEYCDLGAGYQVSKRELFSSWKLWCMRTENRVGAEPLFGRDLRAAFPSIGDARPRSDDGNRQRVYTGIRLVDGDAKDGDGKIVPFKPSSKAYMSPPQESSQ